MSGSCTPTANMKKHSRRWSSKISRWTGALDFAFKETYNIKKVVWSFDTVR